MPIKMNTELFIERAKELHVDTSGSPTYDYSKSIYIKSAQKLIITCKIHGDFEQTPNSHLSNHGCKKCATILIGEKQTLTQSEFIRKCEEKHPNKLDYSKTVYINNRTPAVFICKKCATEFTRDPLHMLGDGRGHGCKTCNRGVKDDLLTFIAKATRTHGDKYKYHLVEYINSLKKVKIECEKGHIFEQSPNKHISGDGCPKCRGYGKTQKDFIDASIEKYGEGIFNYSKVHFINLKTKVILLCNKGHEFETCPAIHLREKSLGGCGDCVKTLASTRMSHTQDEWIKLASVKHNNYYSYDKVVYISSQEPVIICCPKHGDFEQRPACHLSGKGCRTCGTEKCIISKLYTTDDFSKIFEECSSIHSSKYTYSNVYRKDGYLFLDISCEKHGEFSQRYDHHKRGHGCCKCVVNYSKPQVEWLNYLSISADYIQHVNNDGEFKIPGTNMYADGYEPTTNNIYEFQGDFWHGNPDVFSSDDINPRTGTTYSALYEKTQRKITTLKEMGFNVYEMWEYDWGKGKQAIIILQRLWRKKHISTI